MLVIRFSKLRSLSIELKKVDVRRLRVEEEISHKSLPNLPMQLDTERLNIRKYAEGDGRELYLLLERNNNRELLKTNVEEVSSIKTETEAEMRVRKRSAEWVARDRFVMGIWLKSQSMYVGEIWIEPEKWEVPSFEIGWFLDQGYQGRGIATEAVQRSLKFVFNNLKAHKVIVITRDTNSKSYKLAERLGFKREGHLRESRIENGKRYGLFYYGVMRTEFSSK
jgi:RimJ/RimL family protein N-acetyltransferase